MATNFPSNPSDGDTHAGFTYNSTTGAWESSAASGSSIGVLSDVDTATAAPTTGQLLQWNGTNWVPYTHTNGITEVDQWRLNDTITTMDDPLSNNLERVDDATFAKIGTGMSVSNGVWSFPTTGLYEVSVNVSIYLDAPDVFVVLNTSASTDGGSNWDQLTQAHAGRTDGTTNAVNTGASRCLVNVTNTTDVVVKFSIGSIDGTGNYLRGRTDRTDTGFMFIRLGDSQ